LLTRLSDRADDDVVDHSRIQIVPFDQAGEKLGEEVDRVHPCERPAWASFAHRRPDGVDNDSAIH
jgi:hypothetical protein